MVLQKKSAVKYLLNSTVCIFFQPIHHGVTDKRRMYAVDFSIGVGHAPAAAWATYSIRKAL